MEARRKKKIGISGGTFDPIHIGHLLIAEEIRQSEQLDKILFIPSGTPPHKLSASVSAAKHRLEMVRLATLDNPSFEPVDMEIRRPGITYTVDTLEALTANMEEPAEYHYIIGADVVLELEGWKNFRRLSELCSFITAFRPGQDPKDFETGIKRLREMYSTRIRTAGTSMMSISSTEIRNKVAEGKSIKYMVVKEVEEYIIKNGLYKLG
ncbi:MAG TPA: nicotinic acid mononucleotide adenylyltransferase [Clostridiales bacterium]|nr:nicotinic acid mononucleotide adenylyltransferase [Clostridiales bacterium]